MKLEIPDNIREVKVKKTPNKANRLFIFCEEISIEFILTSEELEMFKEALK